MFSNQSLNRFQFHSFEFSHIWILLIFLKYFPTVFFDFSLFWFFVQNYLLQWNFLFSTSWIISSRDSIENFQIILSLYSNRKISLFRQMINPTKNMFVMFEFKIELLSQIEKSSFQARVLVKCKVQKPIICCWTPFKTEKHEKFYQCFS